MKTSCKTNYQGLFPHIGLKVTGDCKYNCPFCCEPNRSQEVYRIDNFKKILDIARNMYGTESVCLTGGDPLLYPQISTVLEHINKLKIESVLLTANGKLFTELYDTIITHLDAVRFSVHGIKKEHDSVVHSAESFANIENALILLKGTKVKRYITTVITAQSINSIPKILKWAAEHGVTKYFLFNLMKSGKGAQFIDNGGGVDNDAVSEMINKIKGIASNSEVEIILYEYKKNAECILIYGNGDIYIDPYPSPPSYQMHIGNVLNDNIEKIKNVFLSDPENTLGYSEHLAKL